jgi:hypothetical protein
VILWGGICLSQIHITASLNIVYMYVCACIQDLFFTLLIPKSDLLCGLVIRVPGCRSRDPGFDSRRYQIFWEVGGLERGPLSVVSTTEELLGRNNSGCGLESREYGHGDTLLWLRDTLYPQKLALTSPTSGCRSVGKVRSRTKATEFVINALFIFNKTHNRYQIVTYTNI